MNYIYDIILNFNEEFYDFYEWNNNDNVINVRKIPVLKVDENTYVSLRNNKIQVSMETIDSLKKNFSLYNEKIEGNIICLITNGMSAFGVMFNNNGYLIKRSGMLFDEEEEVIDESENIKEVKIDFIKNEKQKSNNISRIVKEKQKFIKDYISSLDDELTLKYIYYDYFEKEENKNNIKEILLSEINSKWNSKLSKLYDLTKLLNKVK
mgnify:FL=1